MRRTLLSFVVLLCLAGTVWAASDADSYGGLTASHIKQTKDAMSKLRGQVGNLQSYKSGSMTTRLYGVKFGSGFSALDAAESFRMEHAKVFGVDAVDLVPGSLLKDRRTTQPVMYQPETDDYKFTLVYYHQTKDGVPVFQSELRLLSKNEYDHPLVLAVSTLRDLGDFVPSKAFLGGNSSVALEAAKADEPGLTHFTDQELVVFAGDADYRTTPRMGVKLTGTSDFPEEFLYVIDPETGEILYKENRIVHEDVVGNVSGMTSQNHSSDNCEPEALEPWPWAKVRIGGYTAYTDANGDFVIPNSGTSSVTVFSETVGQWFEVFNYLGSEEDLSTSVTPPGPANFVHNSANTSEHVRAQSNAYVEANIVRDMAIAQNPSYPNLMDTEFPVTVNRDDGYCPGNAWYSPSEESINFCESGGGHPNTAYAAIIHHEYGHHLVNMGGSGQGQYGEGMSDAIYVVISDQSELALGFYGPCNTPLRNADNSHQYPCSGGIHDCGQLLSGCVWDTRNAMVNTYGSPSVYLPILRNLTVNSILLHTGTEITPQITIDFLTLDDNDGNINNGTPHYWEIAAGFALHNMDAPELAPIAFTYPQGTPSLIDPGTPNSFIVQVSGVAGETPVPGTGQLHYKIEGGALVSVDMEETTPNNYIATLPPIQCLERIEYYVSADAEGIGTMYDPNPATPRAAFAATDEVVGFVDGFETDLGWTVSGGSWGRGTPSGGGGQYGNPDPSSAHTGSNVFGYNLSGDYENSLPEHHLTSPAIDCSELAMCQINFYRWLGVETDSYDHAYIRVSNNGSSWTTIWENDGEVTDNSWNHQVYDISSVADGEATVYVRFTMGTTDGSWQYCGWNIDDFELTGYECNANSPNILTTYLPDWTEGHPYSQMIVAEGGTPPYDFSDKNSDLVPTGLSLASDGALTGTPSRTGFIYFTAMVVDDSSYSDEVPYNIFINPAVEITTSHIPDRTAGTPFSVQLEATGGTGSLVWSDKNGDLAGTGLSINHGGQVAGNPVEGVVSFTAVATDGVGATSEVLYTFDVNPALEIITTSLPNADLGAAYSQQLATSGGTGNKTFSDKYGDLQGTDFSLSLGGLLEGTGTTAGTISFTARVSDVGGGADEQAYTFEVIDFLEILTEEVPDWTQGHAMSMNLTSKGGLGAHTWTDKNDDLVGTGLTLGTDGLLSGAPTAAGPISFTALLEDENRTSVEKLFTFQINVPISFTTTSVPEGSLGEPYSAPLLTTGGTGGRVITDKNDDLVGTGLSISPIGQIQGTPSDTGAISFTALATDAVGATAELLFNFNINLPLTIVNEELPEWTVSMAYSEQLVAAGGGANLSWSDKNNDLDGTGLSLSVDGLLSGTPIAAGDINFIAVVTDERATTEKAFNLTVNAAPYFVTTSLPDWTVGVEYGQQMTATGGTGILAFDDLNGMMGSYGLTLGTDGSLSGAPTSSGTITIDATVTDMAGYVVPQQFLFDINPAVLLVTESLPDGAVSTPYSVQLEATGGTGVKTWVDLYGDLAAAGLSLSSDGLVSGTVASEMTISFTAEVVDEVGSNDNQAFTFDIGPAWICGDIDGSGSMPDIADLVYLVAYMFDGGPEPPNMEAANVDGVGGATPDIADMVYLVAYMFDEGAPLVCP